MKPTTRITLRLFTADITKIRRLYPDNYNAAIRKIIHKFLNNDPPEDKSADTLQEFTTLLTSLENEVQEVKEIMGEILDLHRDLTNQ